MPILIQCYLLSGPRRHPRPAMKRPSASRPGPSTMAAKRTSGRGAGPRPSEIFSASATKTIAAPVATVFAAWKDPASRAQWLPVSGLTVRKATPHKSIRILWPDGTTLSVNFWSKGAIKCQVVPLHDHLANSAAAEKMKVFWAERLEALRLFLEKKA